MICDGSGEAASYVFSYL